MDAKDKLCTTVLVLYSQMYSQTDKQPNAQRGINQQFIVGFFIPSISISFLN